MQLEIVEERPSQLLEYARVSVGFTVAAIFDDQAIAALLADEPATPRPLAEPYWKDYDCYAGNHPTDWARTFDISRWTILAAYAGARRVGGAIVVVDGDQIDLLRDCPTCGLLWDIRVHPDIRAQGIGSALLHLAEDVATRRGANALRVETQNVNVPACWFYARNGFELERATPGVYVDLPRETQLLWRKDL
jgi:GNAT superfamily N-acetyltransferase